MREVAVVIESLLPRLLLPYALQNGVVSVRVFPLIFGMLGQAKLGSFCVQNGGFRLHEFERHEHAYQAR